MIENILHILNALIAFMAVPPALFLLREVIKEGKNPLRVPEQNRSANIGLRLIFTLVALVGIVNGIRAMVSLLGMELPSVFNDGSDFVMNIFISLSTLIFYKLYKQT